MRDDPSVVDLVARAAKGDEDAWYEIVDRYALLVWSICARYQLPAEDIKDVFGMVWLGLVEQLGKLREPAALPGWLATTTKRECLRVLKVSRRCQSFSGEPDDRVLAAEANPEMIEEEICKAERNALLRVAVAELPEDCRRLITLLLRDPPLSYAEISARLGIPPGSIGPTRGRCLERLRRSPLLAGLSDTAPPRNTGPSGENGQSAAPPSGGESSEESSE